MGRAPCCSKVGLNRGPWTPEEDMLLSKHIEAHGEGNWRALPKSAGLLRCGKSCRLRWVNYLRPNVKRGNISEDEEDLIIMLHGLLGNRWSLIAARMPGRTDNEIKNYWNTHLSKKLASRGLDPKTHKPISSKTSSVQKKSEELQADDDPQEAWETTMDLDTSSYSAGSCDDGDADLHHRHGLQSKASQKKRQIPEQPQQKKQQIGPVSCANASSKDGGREEQNDKLQLHKQNKFDCPSPSSVLNIYSPSASNTGSNCDSPGISSARATSTSSSVRSHNSSFSSAAPIHDQHLTRDDDHKQQQQQTIATATDDQQQFMEWEEQMQAPQLDVRVQMLEFIDEFLCKEDQDAGIDPHAANLFKEDEGSEFWDSLGKIELPDCSSVCQSDLWDGLTDLVPDHASSPAVAAPSSPQFSFLDSSSQLPLITDLNSSSSAHLPQDGIAELLFCA